MPWSFRQSELVYVFQVELELFPDMRSKKLAIRTVRVEESLVQLFMDRAMDIFTKNTVGPQKYVTTLHRKWSIIMVCMSWQSSWTISSLHFELPWELLVWYFLGIWKHTRSIMIFLPTKQKQRLSTFCRKWILYYPSQRYVVDDAWANPISVVIVLHQYCSCAWPLS